MPELARFYGIIIRMYFEANAPHHRPHFHAYYQDQVAIYTIDEIELISGSLPTRQKRLVEAWAELHQQELVSNWERLQGGQGPRPISPLK
jgi:muramidase (phage lysozyme)